MPTIDDLPEAVKPQMQADPGFSSVIADMDRVLKVIRQTMVNDRLRRTPVKGKA